MSALARTQRATLVVILATLATLTMLGSPTAAQAREEGVANFYSDKFEGKKTASGEVYDKNALTASHKKLPYGTRVKVTNVENGKSVVVTINDRMATSNKAVIDVTRRAAEELGFVAAGRAKVTLEVQK
jgi:rare lipoprotein A